MLKVSLKLVLLWVVVLLGSFAFSWHNVISGITPILRPTYFSALFVGFWAVITFIGGAMVLAYKKGKYPTLQGAQAGYIFLLGRVALLAGAILLALWGGCLLGEFTIWSYIIKSVLNPEVVAILTSFLLFIAGIFTLFSGKLDLSDDEKVASGALA